MNATSTPNEMVYSENTLMRSLYGASRPKVDILNLLDMHPEGKPLLDELLAHVPLGRYQCGICCAGTRRRWSRTSGAKETVGGAWLDVEGCRGAPCLRIGVALGRGKNT